MRLQAAKYPWGCSLAASAMGLGVEQDTLVDVIGHDGSEVIWPDVREPYGRRGFHWQEIIDAALELGFAMIPFEISPVTSPDGNHTQRLWADDQFIRDRFFTMLACRSGVLSGPSSTGYHHAVAWNHEEQRAYDSNGPAIRRFPSVKCQIFFVVFPLHESDHSR